MIRSFRAFFLSRALREKLLLVGFLGVAVVMWASAYSSRITAFFRAEHNTTVALKDQDYWLTHRAQIESATQKAASQMDPSKTLDPVHLTVVVRQLAGDSGVRINTGRAEPEVSNGQFSINRLPVQVLNTDWHAFAVFYQHLQERAPYLAITELAMQPIPANPSQIMATMTVESFEIRH
ncbi:MAG TPA: hypothetical protein VHE61_12670 [Opitutaceae bacterium]|nr:hypothetical protein [Opitutaceae bacterium]